MSRIQRLLKLGVVGSTGDKTAPAYTSGEIGTVNTTTVAVTFSENVAGTNYATGVTIKVNTVAATISTATRQTNKAIVYYVLSAAVLDGDTVTWEYAVATGNITDTAGNTLKNVTAQTATNNVSVTSYYVSKSGNDSTGTGAIGTPWLTLDKALATVPAGGNCNIRMGAGTYAENTAASNYLTISRTYTTWVNVRPQNVGDTVIITDNNSGNHTVYLSNCHYVRFQDVTIQPGTGANWDGVIGGSGATNVKFVNCNILSKNYGAYCIGMSLVFTNCVIDKKAGATGIITVAIAQAGAGVTTALTYNNCTMTSYGGAYAISSTLTNAAGTLSTTINGGTLTAGDWSAVFAHGGSLNINGGTFNNSGAGYPSVIFGQDGAATYTTTGSIANATVNCALSHSLLVGQGSSAVTVTNCTVNSGDIGVVIKGANCTVDGCTIRAGTMNPILVKGAVNPTIQNCTIYVTANTYAALNFALEGSTKVSGCNFNHNHVNASVNANCMGWPDTTMDGLGGVCDYNTYHVTGTGNLGIVRGTSVANLAAMQAAWAGYGDGSNDSHSTVV